MRVRVRSRLVLMSVSGEAGLRIRGENTLSHRLVIGLLSPVLMRGKVRYEDLLWVMWAW